MHEIPNDFRELLIKESETIRRFLPTERQSAIIEFVDLHRRVDSAMLAKAFKISYYSASMQLMRIWEKGYFKRKLVGSSGGGKALYEYSPYWLEEG